MPPRARLESEEKPEVSDKVEPNTQMVDSSKGESAEQPSQDVTAAAGVGVGGREAGAGLRIPLPAALVPNGTDAKRLLWIGGLGAAAVFGVLEWPVALAVGAGSLVAERLARESASSTSTAATTDASSRSETPSSSEKPST
jgi:hypothetical protein